MTTTQAETLAALDAETLEGLIGRVEVSIITVKGLPAIVTRLTHPLLKGERRVSEEYIREDNQGQPWRGKASWDNEDSASLPQHGMDDTKHPLVQWLAGRWVLGVIPHWKLTESGYSPGAIQRALDGLVERIASDIRMTVRDAAFSATFVEALETISLWANGPTCDIGRLFEDRPVHDALRKLVRENPFVTEVLFHDICLTMELEEPTPAEITAYLSSVAPDYLAAFRQGIWTDRDSFWRVTKDTKYVNALFRDVLFDLLPGIDPVDLPQTKEHLKAFLDLLRFLKTKSPNAHKPDVGTLLSKVGADWVGQAERCEAVISRMSNRSWTSSSLSGIVDNVAFSFKHKVLYPLRAKLGTLHPGTSHLSTDSLSPLAESIIFAGRDIDGCLSVAETFHHGWHTIRETLPSESTAVSAEWPALFPDVVVDGFALRCLVSPASLIAADVSRITCDNGSMRSYATCGWVHIVSITGPGSEVDGEVTVVEVTWKSGRWNIITPLRPCKPTGDAALAIAALAVHLRKLPGTQRPEFAPPSLEEQVRDWCGYDWRDNQLLHQACWAYDAILPPAFKARDDIAHEVMEFDFTRPVPPHRNRPFSDLD